MFEKNIVPFFILASIVLVLDGIYLTLAKNTYNKLVRKVQGADISLSLLPTLADYLLIIFSIYYFIILKNASIKDAMILGFCIYGIFDLTNMAIFNKYRGTIVYVDMIWGAILYGTSSYILKTFF